MQKICNWCGSKFENRASNYCSFDCALKSITFSGGSKDVKID